MLPSQGSVIDFSQFSTVLALAAEVYTALESVQIEPRMALWRYNRWMTNFSVRKLLGQVAATSILPIFSAFSSLHFTFVLHPNYQNYLNYHHARKSESLPLQPVLFSLS